jgi:dipeptidyl aminopeptidase/acylaminoacyl peptidase
MLAVLLLATTFAVPDYDAIKGIQKYATKEEYDAARADARFQLTKVPYRSGELEVFAYVYAPVDAKAKLPVIVYNRGSWTWKEFGGELLTTFNRLGNAGFLVVAPMLRGSGGAAGADELGGADLEDLLNAKALLASLPNADTNNVFLYGESRGGMMTYQAIRDRFPARAAAVFGGFTDMGALVAAQPKFLQAAKMIFPDYAANADAIHRRRSVLAWAEKLDVPILIMHGGADTDVPPAQSLALAQKLAELGKRYELVIRNGANHVLTQWRVERDAHAIEWFRRHMAK